MKAGVTKQQLIKSLEATLKLTRAEVKGLELSEDEETVIIEYIGGGSRYVNIACDSGMAIIRDVCRAID